MKQYAKSTEDFESYRRNLENRLTGDNSTREINDFLDWFDAVYGKKKRVYFDWRLIVDAYKTFRHVLDDSMFWVAFVGEGGTGKTTMAKQFLYTLDPTFSYSRISRDSYGFIKSIADLGNYKSVLLDEPDDELHNLSKEARLLKSILGRVRQRNLFAGICATELSSIPPVIYHKLNAIFYMPAKPKFYYFKNNPLKWQFPVQLIKRGYRDKGYLIFKDVLKSWNIRGTFAKDVPISKEQEKKYLSEKAEDLNEYFKKYVKLKENPEDYTIKNPKVRSNVIKYLYTNKRKKFTQKDIAELFGLSRVRVTQIIKDVGKT